MMKDKSKIAQTEVGGVLEVVVDGLRGIPVSSGGMYTDITGTQWIADELDFAKGVRRQRIGVERITSLSVGETADVPGRFLRAGFLKTSFANGGIFALSNLASWMRWGQPADKWVFAVSGSSIYISPPKGSEYTTETLNTLLAEKITEETPLIICGQLATPIEIPLAQDEINAFRALRTYAGDTAISNSAGCWMKAGYRQEAS